MSSSDDDDDCAMAPTGGSTGTVVNAAYRVPAEAPAAVPTKDTGTTMVPARGGFGYLAGCGSGG